MLTEHSSFQGCSNVKGTMLAGVLLLSLFKYDHIRRYFQPLLRLHSGEQKGNVLLKNTCYLYKLSMLGFLLEAWVIRPQTESMLEALWGYRDNRISTFTQF